MSRATISEATCWDWTPAPLDWAMPYVHRFIDELWGSEVAPLECAGRGRCDDCEREGDLLYFGSLALCRQDVVKRQTVARRTAA